MGGKWVSCCEQRSARHPRDPRYTKRQVLGSLLSLLVYQEDSRAHGTWLSPDGRSEWTEQVLSRVWCLLWSQRPHSEPWGDEPGREKALGQPHTEPFPRSGMKLESTGPHFEMTRCLLGPAAASWESQTCYKVPFKWFGGFEPCALEIDSSWSPC